MKKVIRFILVFLVLLQLSSCGIYRQSILFATDEDNWTDSLYSKAAEARTNYRIQPSDYLYVSVYSNGGEIIIDPNNDLRKELQTGQYQGQQVKPRYLVKENGEANLPMLGEVSLSGYTLSNADSLLSVLYGAYYKDPFVLIELTNRRITVLGPQGGSVLPLDNEKMNLIEVIALYGGIVNTGKAHNIRLIRGDLKNPQVQLIDLSTIEGMRMADLNVEPNDIVYIEPIRKPIAEAIRDVTPILGLFTSLLTIVFLINRT